MIYTMTMLLNTVIKIDKKKKLLDLMPELLALMLESALVLALLVSLSHWRWFRPGVLIYSMVLMLESGQDC